MSREEAITKLQRVRTTNGGKNEERTITLEIIAEYLHSIGEDAVAVELERTSDICWLAQPGHHFIA